VAVVVALCRSYSVVGVDLDLVTAALLA